MLGRRFHIEMLVDAQGHCSSASQVSGDAGRRRFAVPGGAELWLQSRKARLVLVFAPESYEVPDGMLFLNLCP